MWISHFIIKHLKIDEFTLQNWKMQQTLYLGSNSMYNKVEYKLTSEEEMKQKYGLSLSSPGEQ